MKRFWSKVMVDKSGCWLWTAARSTGGYGKFKIDGASLYAHRFAWELFKGEIPDNMQVLHRCDTPLCVNPGHLFLGTNEDNRADSVAKGRHAHGERSGRLAKLTAAQIVAIRKDSRTLPEIADSYDVTPSNISLIKLRKNWAHIP